MNQKISSIVAFCVLAVTLPPLAGVSAQGQDNAILTVARNSAIVAGGGKYCKFDEDMVDEYIAKTEARLAVLAADEYEKVLARLEFKNLVDAYSAREPDLGCTEFLGVFKRALRSVQ